MNLIQSVEDWIKTCRSDMIPAEDGSCGWCAGPVQEGVCVAGLLALIDELRTPELEPASF